MVEILMVECTYCGSVIEMNKAVKINLETGEYEYACDNCAIRFNIKGDQEPLNSNNSTIKPVK